MKKLILALALIFLFAGISEARVDKCFWIWDTAVTGANDAPDDVYCSLGGATYASRAGTYIQQSGGATSISVQWDTLTPDGVNTIGDLHDDITDTQVICANTATTIDINIKACSDGTCDTGTTTYAYHQEDGLATDLVDTFELTPPSDGFKISIDRNTAGNGCMVIRTTTILE